MKAWCVVREDDGTVRHGDHDADVSASAFVWCHFNGRNADTLTALERHGLPDAVVRALTATETRPRSEAIGEGALVNLRGLGDTPEDDPDALVSIRLWAERGRVVSVSYRTLATIDEVREKMAAGRLRDPGDLITAMALSITETLDPVIAALGDEVDSCETDLDADQAFALRRTIGRARREAIAYRRFVAPQRQALERLAVLQAEWLEEDDRLHLRDAADRFARMAEELEAVRERSALLHEQLTDLRAEVTEQRTLVLSIVALVFLPLTFITGLFGMNYPFPFQDEKWPFWAVLGFCAALAAGITGYFVRSHWFRR